MEILTATDLPQFVELPKIARLSRNMVVTEKIDGTNASVFVTDGGAVVAASRNRWITPENDNFGFARWVKEHEDELRVGLGPGHHFGEWWGPGIQRGYGMAEKRFSLFNARRWGNDGTRPPCCHVVPVLRVWTFDTAVVDECLAELVRDGSKASPGFMRPEGVVVFHVHGNVMFKKTIERDSAGKGNAP